MRRGRILSAVNVLLIDVQTQAEDNCIIDREVVFVASRWTADARSGQGEVQNLMHDWRTEPPDSTAARIGSKISVGVILQF